MCDASLDSLLSQILSADNVQRTVAERELERRSREVPGFCVALAELCRTLSRGGPPQRATTLVALSVLKRGFTGSDRPAEVQQVIAVLLTEVGSIAGALPCGGSAAAVMRQWTATVSAAVRRLATVSAASASPVDSEATANAITAQLLAALEQPANASGGDVLAAYSHVWLLRTLFEEPVPPALRGWCGELLLSCAPALFTLLCDGAATAAAAAERETLEVRCALVTLVARTLGALYEWQLSQSGRQRFPAELKQHFLAAFPRLQPFACTPCTHWLSQPSASSSAGSASGAVQAVATCVAAASLSVLEFVASVLQYGGWYKRCVTAALLQATLQSLAADAECHAAVLGLEGEDAEDELAVDGSWIKCDAVGDAAPVVWAAVVRRRAAQCWSFFRDTALLSLAKTSFVDVVGHQCGLQYYRLLLNYAALALSDAEASLQDPNAFLRGEEEREDGLRWTARDIVAQLYADSITVLGPLFLHASLEDLNECLFTGVADAATPAFTPSQQRREAAMFFMETVLRHRARALRECGVADFMPLATHVWASDVAGAGTHPVVAARALQLLMAVFAFTVAAAGGEAAVETFTMGAVADSVRVLSAFTGTAEMPPPAQTCTPLVALLLCRLLQSTLRHWPRSLLVQHLAAWQRSLLALLSLQAGLTEEALYSTVEQLADVVRAGRAANGGSSAADCPTSPVLETLPPAVMDCWRRHVSDPSFADAVLRLLRRLVRDSDNGASLLLGELPWVNSILSGYAESMAELCAIPHFLRLLTHVFEHATDEVANAAAALMLDGLCQLLLCTDESAILAASSSCLAALLRRCPAAQSVMVRVVPASVEAALCGGEEAAGGSSGVQGLAALLSDAPRAAYPFSSVIVAIVLRTLDDRRDEASLMDMGDALVTIMRQSTSFSEAELVRVIHATVHRLAVVRTDTVAQQLLAPLATLLHLHPVALLRTLVQGGLLAETMRRWLPQVEHFSSLSATYASCIGLLQLLACLAPAPSPCQSASMTAEEVQHIAQQPVMCRWRLAEGLASANAGPRKTSRKSKKAGGGSSSSAASSPRSVLSSLMSGATVETAQPLYAAVLVGVGRGLLPLLSAPAVALRRASRAAAAVSNSDDDEDEADVGALFRENSSDDEGAWGADDGDDSVEEVSGGDDDVAGDAAVLPDPSGEAEAAAERQRLLASMGAAMLPWMQAHGGEVTAYFTAVEAQRLMSFFTASATGSSTSGGVPSP